MSSTTIAVLIHAVVGVCLIVAASVLLGLHDLTESTALAIMAAGVGLGGGSSSTLLALQVKPPDGGGG